VFNNNVSQKSAAFSCLMEAVGSS